MLFLALSFSTEIFSQQVKTFKVQNASLEECLKQIEKQTGYGYLFKGNNLAAVKGITYSAQNVDLKEILKNILANTGYTYELNNKVILIVKAPQKRAQVVQPPVPKAVSIRVFVLDSLSKDPLIGAACMLKNYGIYGVADIDGTAILKNVPTGEVVMEIQMLGYKTYTTTFQINAPKDLRVALQPQTLELD